jgi:hypothetical protein
VDPSTCSQGYANAPCPPPPPHFTDAGVLPFTGGVMELLFLCGLAVVAVSLALLLRYKARA